LNVAHKLIGAFVSIEMPTVTETKITIFFANQNIATGVNCIRLISLSCSNREKKMFRKYICYQKILNFFFGSGICSGMRPKTEKKLFP